MKAPAFIQSSVSTQRILLKEFSHNDLMVSVVDRSRDVRYVYQDLVMVINGIKELKTEHFQKSGKVLVILNGVPYNEVKDQLKISISQEVYLYETETKTLFESYQVNSVFVDRKIGRLDGHSHFKWAEGIQPK